MEIQQDEAISQCKVIQQISLHSFTNLFPSWLLAGSVCWCVWVLVLMLTTGLGWT